MRRLGLGENRSYASFREGSKFWEEFRGKSGNCGTLVAYRACTSLIELGSMSYVMQCTRITRDNIDMGVEVFVK